MDDVGSIVDDSIEECQKSRADGIERLRVHGRKHNRAHAFVPLLRRIDLVAPAIHDCVMTPGG